MQEAALSFDRFYDEGYEVVERDEEDEVEIERVIVVVLARVAGSA